MKRPASYFVAFCLLSSSLSISPKPALANQELRATGPTIATGLSHSCAIDTQGTVKCWGSSLASPVIPAGLPGLGARTQIAAGAQHTCAVGTEGAVACWGYGPELPRIVPSGLGKVDQIEAGDHNTCAVNSDHQLYCWGLNTFGETTDPNGIGQVLTVSAGYYHTCAVTQLGQVRCWGRNKQGQTDVPSDLGKVVQISAGYDHTCALNDQGVVRCWGIKSGRSIVPGLGKVTQLVAGKSSTCVILELGSVTCWDDYSTWGLVGIEKAIQVTVGNSHSCAVTDQSEVICWGDNAAGQSTVPAGLTALTSYATLKQAGMTEVLGASAIGNELSVNTGVWDEGVTFAYKWLRDGVEIPNATSSSYMVVPEDFSSKLSVRVIGSKPFFLSAESSSAEVAVTKGSIKQTATPEIVGNFVVGSKLTVKAGTWDAGVTLKYQWLRDGVEIRSATTPSRMVVPEDVSSRLSVRVTGSKPYFLSVESTSVEALVSKGSISQSAIPQVVGNFLVGSKLTVNTGAWDAGVTFAYKWLRDGVPIPGAVFNGYTPSEKDYFTGLSVEIEATKEGFQSEIRTSLERTIWPRNFNTASIPKVRGIAKVGQTLTINRGAWESGTNFSYQWLRNGKPIAKATNSRYKLLSLDKGAKLSVRLTAKKIGYLSITKTSSSIVVG